MCESSIYYMHVCVHAVARPFSRHL